MSQRVCKVCGCTDHDCRKCIEKTGSPCSWAEPGLCSACAEEIISGGIIVQVDGTTKKTAPKNGNHYVLKELQQIVDGYIEFVHIHLAVPCIMVVNEDGKFTKTRNPKATVIADDALNNWDFITGDVLICPKTLIR